jgi:hypothetical protein
VWAGYGTASVAALIGCGTLWQQRGLLERHAKEMARRRRADLDKASVVAQGYANDIERAQAELEHERQYSILIQDQLSRAREQLDKERAARRAAERELDTLTGTAGWHAGRRSMLLTVEEPLENRADGAQDEEAIASSLVEQQPAAESKTTVQPSSVQPSTGQSTTVPPTTTGPVTTDPAAPLRPGLAAAQRRGWQIMDGEGEDAETLAAETDRLYRPFIDQLTPATVPVSDAALAMAPVIGAVDSDDILDLTAYDETVEFSVREMKRMA